MDRETFREIAWRDFILFAAQDNSIIAHYENETGRKMYARPTSPIDSMIDDATDHAAKSAEDFMLWVTENHWGADEAPAKVREKLAARERREV